MCSVQKRGRVYILTLTGDSEHRFNPTLLSEILSALTRIRSSVAGSSAALVTAAEGKFFSNGMDLSWARTSQNPNLMGSAYVSTLAALVSMPIPTIAAVTGHAAAGGFFFLLAHDYIMMRRERGFLYMSELDVGLPISDKVMALARAKMGPLSRRRAMLKADKMTADAAAEMGFVDGVYAGAADTLDAAVRLGEKLAGMGWNASARIRIFPELAKIVDQVEGDKPKLSKLWHFLSPRVILRIIKMSLKAEHVQMVGMGAKICTLQRWILYIEKWIGLFTNNGQNLHSVSD